MMGGDVSLGFDVLEYSKEDINKIAVDAVRSHLGFSEQPDEIYCNILLHAIPQYYVGHHNIVRQIEEESKLKFLSDKKECLISLGGNYMGGVSINDCVKNGNQLASWFIKTHKQ